MASIGGRESQRHRLLADMGIDVWVLRGETGSPSPPKPMPAATVQSQPVPVVPVRAPAPAASVAVVEAVVDVPGSDSDPEPQSASTETAVPAKDLQVVCLVSPEVLMLVDDGNADRRRLLVDIFMAAAGIVAAADSASEAFDSQDPSRLPKELAFSWNGDEQSQWRALGAFVDKQLLDHAPKLIICSTGLSGHLPGRAGASRLIELPVLAELGKRVELKRRLWQQIQDLQT